MSSVSKFKNLAFLILRSSPSRYRTRMEDHQDSAKLEFDSIWKEAKCLNICEVEQLLKTPYLQGEAGGATKPHLEMAFKHARRFSKLRDAQALAELRMALEDWEAPSSVGTNQSDSKLSPFEQAQLVNLVPGDAEEAMSLIPSLLRFSPIDVASILDIISSFMKLGGAPGASIIGQLDSSAAGALPF